MNCRVFKNGQCKVTFPFKGASHKGIDMVGPNSTFDYIVAHSDGEVVAVISDVNYNTSKTGQRTYGNYVKIRHDNGMYTLYAHMKYGSVEVKVGQRVSKGQTLGYMGNTGYSFGAHLHFEVRDENNNYIDPTQYVDGDLPVKETPVENRKTNEQLADEVMAGKWGNGEERKTRLAEAGYSWGEVQAIVDARCEGTVDNSNSDIKVGDTVRVKKGARSYNDVLLASFVFNNEYEVMELYNDRAVIGKNGVVTTDIHINNLYK